MIYSFDERVAKEVGVNAAIILDKFTWWIRQNEANERNCHDGRYWTFNSTKALTSMFPFFNAKQIGRILKKLIDDGYLLTGNYNSVAFDRTLWYTLSDKGEMLMQDEEMHFPKTGNEISQKWEMRFPENGKPIPLSTNTNTNDSMDDVPSDTSHTTPKRKKFIPPTLEEVAKYIAEKRLCVNPQKFFDYYEAGDWHDAKGKAVKNWKQKCLTWDKHDNNGGVTKQEPVEQISGAEFIRREEERLRKQRERDMRLAEIAAQQEQAMMG